jgi:hypothetical protein
MSLPVRNRRFIPSFASRISVPMIAACLVLAPAVAFVQQQIERQMTPEQFKSAGLHKLSADELAYLNAWLNDTLEVETTKAATKAKDKVETENRGFASFGRSDPILARIVGEFRGFGRGRSYTLDNGQVWQQVDDAVLHGVRADGPAVRIKPSVIGNAWYMTVEGRNTTAMVRRVK